MQRTSWEDLKVRYILVTLNAFLLCFPLHFPLHFILDYTTRIPRSVLGRYIGRIDLRFHISRHLSVESGPKVSEVGSVRALRPNSVSDFQYRPVLDIRSVGSVPRSKPGVHSTGIHYCLYLESFYGLCYHVLEQMAHLLYWICQTKNWRTTNKVLQIGGGFPCRWT